MLRYLPILLLVWQCHSQTLEVTATNRSINAKTNYTVRINRTSATANWSNATYFELSFIDFSGSQLSGATCLPTCSITGTVVRLNSTQITASQQLQLTIINIANPPAVYSTSRCNYTLLANSSTVLEQSQFDIGSFLPGYFKQCTLGFVNGTLHTNSTGVFSLQLQNPVLTNGSIVVRLPSQWANTIVTGERVLSSGLSCMFNTTNGSKGNPKVDCIADLSATAITIGPFADGLTTNDTLMMNLTSMLTPPTSLSEQTIQVASYDSSFNLIDNYTDCTILVPAASSLNISVLDVPLKVGVSSNLSISFNSTDLIGIGDTLELDIAGIKILQATTLSIATTQSNGLVYTNNLTLSTSLSNVTAGKLVYVLPRLYTRSILPVNSIISVTGMQLLPPVNNQTATLKTALLRNNASFSLGNNNITVIPSSPTNLSVTASNSTVSVNAIYTVRFSLSANVSTLGRIELTLPNELISSMQICGNFSVNSTLLAAVGCSITNGVLLIKPALQLPRGTRLTISFNGTNPPSQKPTGTFTTSTYYDNSSYVTDCNTTMVYSAQAAFLPQVSISLLNHTVGATTTYTFMVTLQSDRPVGSQFLLTLCAQSVFSNNGIEVWLNGINSTSWSIFNSTVNLTTTSDLLKNSTANITVVGIVNPNSTRPASSFAIGTAINGYRVEANSTGLKVAASTVPAAFVKTPSIVPDTRQNGADANLTITFWPSVNYLNGSLLLLTIPQELALPTNITTCTSLTGFANNVSVVCRLLNLTTLQVVLLQSLSSTLNYSLVLGPIKNSRTSTLTGNFTVLTLTNDSLGSIDYNHIGGLSNTSPNYIKNLSMIVVSPSQSYRASIQTIQFHFQLANQLVSSDYLQLKFPTNYTLVGSPKSICSGSIQCTPSFSSDLTVRVSNLPTNSTHQMLTITGYQSPSVNSTEPFNITTFDANGNTIDTVDASSSSVLYFSTTCLGGCMTCQSSNTSACTSCYNSTLDNRTILNNFTNSCVQACETGYYANGAFCAKCTQNCLSCNASGCQSCASTYSMYNATCVSSCPGHYYQINWTCQTCFSTCENCSISATNCSSCYSGLELHMTGSSGSCLTCNSTNSTKLYYNADSKSCVLCEPPCLRCSGLICLECYSPYQGQSYLLEDSQCVNGCSSGRAVYLSECVKDCPVGYVPAKGQCVYSDAPIVPVPFSLAAIVVTAIWVVAKCVSSHTSIAGLGGSLYSILMTVASIVLVVLAFSNSLVQNYSIGLLVAGLALQLITNIAALVVFSRTVRKDSGFNRWRHSNMPIGCSHVTFIVYFFSTVNANFLELLFCKAFGIRSLSAPLTDRQRYQPLAVALGISMAAAWLQLAGSVTIVIRTRPAQLLMLCIDSIVLSVLVIIFVALNIRKPQGYFEEDSKYRNEIKSEVNLHAQTNMTQEDLDGGLVAEREWGRAGHRPTYRHDDSQAALEQSGTHNEDVQVVIDEGDEAQNQLKQPTNYTELDVVYLEEQNDPKRFTQPQSLNSPSKVKRRALVLTVEELNETEQLEVVHLPSSIKHKQVSISQQSANQSFVEKLNIDQPQEGQTSEKLEQEPPTEPIPANSTEAILIAPQTNHDNSAQHGSQQEKESEHNSDSESQKMPTVMEESHLDDSSHFFEPAGSFEAQRPHSYNSEEAVQKKELLHECPTSNFSKTASQPTQLHSNQPVVNSKPPKQPQQQPPSINWQNQISLPSESNHKPSLTIHSSIPLVLPEVTVFDLDRQLERMEQVGRIVRNASGGKPLQYNNSNVMAKDTESGEEVPNKPCINSNLEESYAGHPTSFVRARVSEWYEDSPMGLPENRSNQLWERQPRQPNQTEFRVSAKKRLAGTTQQDYGPVPTRIPPRKYSAAEDEQDILTYFDYGKVLAGESDHYESSPNPAVADKRVYLPTDGRNIISEKAQRLRAIYLNRTTNPSRAKSRSRSRV